MKNVKIKEVKGVNQDVLDLSKMPVIDLPRTFRWTLESNIHPEIKVWFKRLKTDYVTKTIEAEIYDDANGAVFSWLQDVSKQTKQELILTHLSGTGKAIGTLIFSGLKLSLHETDYDYGKNSVLTHKISISYNGIDRKNGGTQ